MRDMQINVKGKSYLKMLEISKDEERIQIATSIEKNDFEVKFFKIIETDEGIKYEDVDSKTLEELKKIYDSSQSEKIFNS